MRRASLMVALGGCSSPAPPEQVELTARWNCEAKTVEVLATRADDARLSSRGKATPDDATGSTRTLSVPIDVLRAETTLPVTITRTT